MDKDPADYVLKQVFKNRKWFENDGDGDLYLLELIRQVLKLTKISFMHTSVIYESFEDTKRS